MDIEITEKKDNALYGRTDVRFMIRHDGEQTPGRAQIRQLLASEIGTKTDNVVIDHMESATGMAATRGVARAYKSVDIARASEPEYLQRRNNIWVEPKKEEKEAA